MRPTHPQSIYLFKSSRKLEWIYQGRGVGVWWWYQYLLKGNIGQKSQGWNYNFVTFYVLSSCISRLFFSASLLQSINKFILQSFFPANLSDSWPKLWRSKKYWITVPLVCQAATDQAEREIEKQQPQQSMDHRTENGRIIEETTINGTRWRSPWMVV